MEKSLIENFRKKSTEELEQIFQKHDRTEYTDGAFDAIRQVLEERGKIPFEQQVATSEPISSYASTYETTRSLAKFVSFFGWVVLAISGGIGFILFFKTGLLTGLAALGGVISGLLLVMTGQFTRATIDTADNTGKMLSLMKSKQGSNKNSIISREMKIDCPYCNKHLTLQDSEVQERKFICPECDSTVTF